MPVRSGAIAWPSKSTAVCLPAPRLLVRVTSTVSPALAVITGPPGLVTGSAQFATYPYTGRVAPPGNVVEPAFAHSDCVTVAAWAEGMAVMAAATVASTTAILMEVAFFIMRLRSMARSPLTDRNWEVADRRGCR